MKIITRLLSLCAVYSSSLSYFFQNLYFSRHVIFCFYYFSPCTLHQTNIFSFSFTVLYVKNVLRQWLRLLCNSMFLSFCTLTSIFFVLHFTNFAFYSIILFCTLCIFMIFSLRLSSPQNTTGHTTQARFSMTISHQTVKTVSYMKKKEKKIVVEFSCVDKWERLVGERV